MFLTHFGNHLLRCDTELLRFEHDRRAVGVVGADEVDLVAAHSLVTDPDISLDVLQHMAEVDGAVGVRQRARYQNFLRDLSHSERYFLCSEKGFRCYLKGFPLISPKRAPSRAKSSWRDIRAEKRRFAGLQRGHSDMVVWLPSRCGINIKIIIMNIFLFFIRFNDLDVCFLCLIKSLINNNHH